MGDKQSSQATFHRPPRSWPDSVPSEELRIHAPPNKPEPPQGGLMQAMFPVIGSFSMVGFAGEYSSDRAPEERNRSLRELAAVMVVDWPELGLAT